MFFHCRRDWKDLLVMDSSHTTKTRSLFSVIHVIMTSRYHNIILLLKLDLGRRYVASSNKCKYINEGVIVLLLRIILGADATLPYGHASFVKVLTAMIRESERHSSAATDVRISARGDRSCRVHFDLVVKTNQILFLRRKQ